MRDSSSLDLFDHTTAIMDSDYLPSGDRDGRRSYYGDIDHLTPVDNRANTWMMFYEFSSCFRPTFREFVNLLYLVFNKEAVATIEDQPSGLEMISTQLLTFALKTLSKEHKNKMRKEQKNWLTEPLSSRLRGVNNNDSDWSIGCCTVVRVKTLHISSPILVAKSPIFYKWNRGGCSHGAFEFYVWQYLNINIAPALLDVLMAGNKFEVASCTRYCSCLLRNLPMIPESALLYLELPSSVPMADVVQPLRDPAKQFLATWYKDITK
ncbi:hypothetical protein LguiB_027311 [Lonicera macranthoides]